MDRFDEVLRTLGRIEGQLVGIGNLSVRVARLEAAQAWLRGGWTALAAAWAYLGRHMFSK